MKTLSLTQGSTEWHQHRATSCNASEAPAMMGLSPYKSRNDLLREKATGIIPEIDNQTQERFNKGHEAEAKARPIAESIIGEDLFPVVGEESFHPDVTLSGSFDGITMSEEIIWEHKLWNETLAEEVRQKKLSPVYTIQMDQLLMISGAKKCLFMCSDGTQEKCLTLWYTPQLQQQKDIVSGWAQFLKDLDCYQQPKDEIPVSVANIEELPALAVELIGEVKSSNIVTWQQNVVARIQGINTDLQTDEDFAIAEKTVKFLDDGEKRLDLVKAQALSQTRSIDELFRTIDNLKSEMRAKRLNLDKLVKARKESIRLEIISASRKALDTHCAALNQRLKKSYLSPMNANFAGIIKGKKTIKSVRDAVDAELTRQKLEANAIADRIEMNLQAFNALASGYDSLFTDLPTLVLKSTDDFVPIVKMRIANHQAEEGKRAEAKRMTDAKREEPLPIAEKIVPMPSAPQMTAPRKRPTDRELIDVLAKTYQVSTRIVIEWLKVIDLESVAQTLAGSRE